MRFLTDEAHADRGGECGALRLLLFRAEAEVPGAHLDQPGAGVGGHGRVEYPAKGWATGGGRCMRLLLGEAALVAGPSVGVSPTDTLVKLPAEAGKRDAAGTPPGPGGCSRPSRRDTTALDGPA